MGKPKQLTQRDRVLQYIKDFGCITSWEAYTELGITQLATRVYELKKLGYKFENTRVHTTNRYGNYTHYDEYRLVVDSEVAS